ncbi:hypothetical protein FTO68_09400 [Methanocalculus taiwanensis]|uniref:DUF3821 domain-containing protein n=1 Tax=Methanocalculus taiwanensis TaxID=106207 RepID=A0ABD4TLM1_9EURY|nr:hypothetical protein [Methanocalculus taiwanensis]MCQ1539192.1 hypothetical protein [Methanocalculus taiwanensis]
MRKKRGKQRILTILIVLIAILGIPAAAAASMSGSLHSTAKGDSVFIEGYAYGSPSAGVAVWIFGNNYYFRDTQSVESDAGFSYELTGSRTSLMAPGQYFAVVQHPMANNRFDVIEDTTTTAGTTYVRMRGSVATSGADVFIAAGPGRLQGSNAAEALIRLLDSQNIDDTYMRTTFLIEEPRIEIDTIRTTYTAERFMITGRTNLAVGNDLLVEVVSSAFGHTSKTKPEPFSGASGITKVVPGDAFSQRFFFEVDPAAFLPDEYTIKITSLKTDQVATTTLTVIEGKPPAEEPAVVPPAPTPSIDEPEIPTPTPEPEPEKSPLLYASLAALFVMAVFACRRG